MNRCDLTLEQPMPGTMTGNSALNPGQRCPASTRPGLAASRAGGFTLIELLAVIALIALWALMLVPALARTSPNVKAWQCINNLKHWGLAQHLMAGDNQDMLATDGMGSNKLWPGVPAPSGTPDDPYAWFNAAPPYIAEKMCWSNYYHLPYSSGRLKFPLPGRNGGKIWVCPSATMSDDDINVVAGQGQYGFFSLADNTDLKESYTYPRMPTLGILKKPSATVLMFDVAYNPVTEIVNASPQYNSVNPANRFNSIGVRHNLGTVITFTDGHASCFRISSVTNTTYGVIGSHNEPLNPNIIWNPTLR